MRHLKAAGITGLILLGIWLLMNRPDLLVAAMMVGLIYMIAYDAVE